MADDPHKRDYGADLSLLRENLRRTPLERVRRAAKARRFALSLLSDEELVGRSERNPVGRIELRDISLDALIAIKNHQFRRQHEGSG